tara:strand:- start:2024 stop:2167 length:144 start_codon:yes stop_codon:yes gene_type:complete
MDKAEKKLLKLNISAQNALNRDKSKKIIRKYEKTYKKLTLLDSDKNF